MRVAISTDDSNGLDSVVSPHFGRCPYYVLVDLDGRQVSQVKALENPVYGKHQPGQVPGFINSHGADVMLAGGMGQRAIAFFQQYGIEAATGASGTVRRALEQYLGGTIQGAEPCRVSVEHAQEEVAAEGEYEEDAAGRLREEVNTLQQQLNEAMERIDILTAD